MKQNLPTSDPRMTTSSTSGKRLCCVCDRPYNGRSDKIFCDDHCRNRYHAELRRHTKTAAQVKTKIMYKNYAILGLLMAGNARRMVVKKRELQRQGFNFEVVTGVRSSSLGLRFDLFEFSYRFTANNNVVVERDVFEQAVLPFVYKRWERHWKPLQTDMPGCENRLGTHPFGSRNGILKQNSS